MEKNKNIDPNTVYKKKKKAARTLLSLDPHTPIIKNIGIKILSKKIKNEIRSNALKVKIRKRSKSKKYKQNSFTCKNFFFHEVNKHKGMIKVLNKIKNNDIPSTPKGI